MTANGVLTIHLSVMTANGVLNIPNPSGGCTCNYMPVSQAFVPTWVIEDRE